MRAIRSFFARKGEPAATAVPAEESVEALLSAGLLVVFKHSTACPMSWAAQAQISRFERENPGVPVRTVRVIQERPLSLAIAEATGVRHESPQVLVLRRGEVLDTASHGEITAERLAQMLAEAGVAK
jgi:bacillithiol system protein YtxJ